MIRKRLEHQNYFISPGSGGEHRVAAGLIPNVYLVASYTGSDPIGLELAGSLKNVYAIAAGMSDGLGYENNTRAS